VTSQPEPAPRDAMPAAQTTNPLREPAALVLLGANALLLLVGLVDLLVPLADGDSFARRAGGAFFNFAGLAAVLLPVLAVLLATHVRPPVRRAKLITQVALGPYTGLPGPSGNRGCTAGLRASPAATRRRTGSPGSRRRTAGSPGSRRRTANQ